MSKEIHIVFQVLNFFKTESPELYKLNSTDKLLLLTLASFQGEKGIFPSIHTLSKIIKKNYFYVMRRLRVIESTGLLKMKCKKGAKHHYFLTFLDNKTTDLEVSSLLKTTDQEISGKIQTTDQEVSKPLTSRSQTTDQEVRLVVKEYSNKRERGANAPHTLTNDFQPTDEQKQYCLLNRIDIGSELVRFVLMSKAKGTKFTDWHAAFDLWLGNARRQPSMTGETTREDVEAIKRPPPSRYPEARSAVKFFDEIKTEEVKSDPDDWRNRIVDERMKELQLEGTKFN